MSDIFSNTYVYDGVEVTMTGRVATRARSATNRVVIGTPDATQETIYEVSPVDKNMHGDWHKWVSINQLFTIQEL